MPRDTIANVLDKARMAPSSLNFQPWTAVVLSGQPLAALSQAMKAATPEPGRENARSSDNVTPQYLARRDAITAERMASLGIAREDTAARAGFQRRNLDFFGAPTVLFAFIPRQFTATNQGSVGLWLQTVMLLLVEAGLGCCPQESLADHAVQVKAAAGVDDDEYRFWCGLAIGWPDKTAPVNNYPRPRAPLDEQARFVGFD